MNKSKTAKKPANRPALFLVLAFALLLSACREEMVDQPRYEPLEASSLNPKGGSAFQLVPGTVPRGSLDGGTAFETGLNPDGSPVQEIPVPVDLAMVQRGQALFNAYCSPCHGLSGYGDGIVVQQGFSPPPSYHLDYLKEAPDGHFFDVISNGFGQMYSFDYRLKPADRWAVVSYIRALQLSQGAPEEYLTDQDRQRLGGG